MSDYKSMVYIKWNDACEADQIDEVTMETCVQEAAGFLADKDSFGNYYVARDYNHMNEGQDRFEKVIRIPEEYIIEIEFFEL